MALGTSPTGAGSLPRRRGSGFGAALNSACVYGCCGALSSCCRVPISTIRPRYITAIRSAT